MALEVKGGNGSYDRCCFDNKPEEKLLTIDMFNQEPAPDKSLLSITCLRIFWTKGFIFSVS